MDSEHIIYLNHLCAPLYEVFAPHHHHTRHLWHSSLSCKGYD
jgi:hypothetical protein